MSRSGKTGKKPKKGGRGPRGAAAQAEAQAQASRLIELYRGGRLQEALDGARAFSERWPGLAVGWNVMGTSAQGLGQVQEAVRAYRRAAKIEPDNPATRNNLGLMLTQLERFDEAVREFRAALRAKPDFFEALFNLGMAHEGAGAPAEAERHYRDLLQRHPRLGDAHNRLGNVLLAQGRGEEALAAYDEAIAIDSGHAGFHTNRGNVLSELERLAEAEAAYRRALELQPDDPGIHNNLGNLLRRRGKLADAESIARAGLARDERRTDLLMLLAATLRELGRVDEAIERCREAVLIDPEQPEVHNALANALADGGQLEAADAAYRRALELRPDYTEAVYHLAILRRPADPAAELAAVQARLERQGWSTAEAASLYYAAGKLAADADEAPERVFGYYREGARLRRETLDYDVGADERRFAAIARAFPRGRIEALAGAGHDSDVPVFIVGMPRSGTSLIEQILASHPRVHGAGERRDLGTVVADCDSRFGKNFPEWVEALDGATAAEIGRRYCESLIDPATEADRVTDKLPGNFVHCGLIAAALPNARIVHVRRDPVDTCLSCFSYLFAGRQAFTYDLEELGRYYRAYHGLMAHWRETLSPERLLEIDYETLVAEPETEVAQLLTHCGLAWDDACLAFHRTERSVRTASANQVRQPLYASAVGRWRRYESELQPLLEALGPLAPDS
jgi:tetratricopeptide (TPR) repeat protein